MAELITTTKNKTYKYIRSLLQKKFRTEYMRYTVEGVKSVRDAIAAGAPVELIAAAESFDAAELFVDIPYVTIRDDIFGGLCDTKTPQGIIAVIKMRDNTQYTCDREKLYIYCDGVSDPGNLGTIFRAGEAAGVTGIVMDEGTCDPWSPKVVRSTMGSIFRMPFFTAEDLPAETARLADAGIRICAADMDGEADYTRVDYTGGSAFLIGNEGNGLSAQMMQMADTRVRIPMCGRVESLNAAMAASVLMFEAARQRREVSGR